MTTEALELHPSFTITPDNQVVPLFSDCKHEKITKIFMGSKQSCALEYANYFVESPKARRPRTPHCQRDFIIGICVIFWVQRVKCTES